MYTVYEKKMLPYQHDAYGVLTLGFPCARSLTDERMKARVFKKKILHYTKHAKFLL